MSSARSRFRTTRGRCDSGAGARENPQLPMTTDVTPWYDEHVPSGSQNTWASMCVCPSTNPGATTSPSAEHVARGLSHSTDGDDTATRDPDVRAVPRQPGSVHH